MLRIKDVKLIRICCHLHEADIFVLVNKGTIWFSDGIFLDHWEHIDVVTDFVHFAWVSPVFYFTVEPLFVEYRLIFKPQFENWRIIWSHIRIFISVSWWPLVIVELEAENVAVEEGSDFNSLVNELWNILLEQVGRHKCILVFGDVINDVAHSSNLVVPHCTVNSWPIKVSAFVIAFLDFVLVEDRILHLEVLFVLVV